MRTGISKIALEVQSVVNNLGKGNGIWVDGGKSSYPQQDGSFSYPFQTFPAGVAALGGGKNTIFLMPGTYNLGGTGVTIPSGGFSVVGFDVNNTIITSSVDTISGSSIAGDILLKDLILATSGAYSALKVDGMSATKKITLQNVILTAPATGFGGWFKNIPVQSGSWVNALFGGGMGRLYFENASPILHGMNAQVIGATNVCEIKNCAGGFINDMAIVGTQAKSLIIDNSTGIVMRSVEVQSGTYSGSNNLIEIINNSQIQVSDVSTTYNGSGDAWYSEVGTNIQVITWEGNRSKFNILGSINRAIYADDIQNDTSYQQGATVQTALNNIRVQPDTTLVGATPAASDVNGWIVGSKGIGIGTDSSVWLIYKDGASSIKSVQLT